MVPVLIPMKQGNTLTGETLKSIIEQSMDTSVIPVTCRPESDNRRANEAVCRNVLLGMAEDLADEYFVMMDDDVVLPDRTCLERGILQLLAGGHSLGAVHIRYKAPYNPEHFDIGCVVVRRNAACCVAFDTKLHDADCHCNTFSNRLRANNFRQEWLTHA